MSDCFEKKFEEYLKDFTIWKRIELEKNLDFLIISSMDADENTALIIKTNGYSETGEEYRKHIIDTLRELKKRVNNKQINSALTITFTESVLFSVGMLCYRQMIPFENIISAFIRFEEFDKYSEKMNEWFLKVLKYC